MYTDIVCLQFDMFMTYIYECSTIIPCIIVCVHYLCERERKCVCVCVCVCVCGEQLFIIAVNNQNVHCVIGLNMFYISVCM